MVQAAVPVGLARLRACGWLQVQSVAAHLGRANDGQFTLKLSIEDLNFLSPRMFP